MIGFLICEHLRTDHLHTQEPCSYDKAWQSISRYTVFIGNMAKFSQHVDLKEKLLSTGKKIIVEASPYDALWGVALGPWDDKILKEGNWQG